METLRPTLFKQSIYDISYGEFIELYLGDTSVLPISGNPTDEDLQDARTRIIMEFQDKSGNAGFKANLKSNLKYMELSMQVTAFNMLSELIKVRDFHEVENLLRATLFEKTFKWNESEWVRSLTERIRKHVAQLNVRIKDVMGKTENDKKNQPNKEDFVALMVNVSRFLKFNVDFNTNAGVFAQYVYQLQCYNSQMEAQDLKRKLKR